MSETDVGFVQHLIHSGKYWVLQVMDDEWPDILTHYLWPYMPQNDDGEPDADQVSYMANYDGYAHYFIAKEYVPSHVLAKMLGVPVYKIYESKIIALRKLKYEKETDKKPNVDYFGEA